MKWYEKFSQIVNPDFYTNYVDFFKKETGQEELELFWEKLYECSTEWEQKYHLYARRYHLYGVKAFDLDVEIDEFVFDENIDKEKYFYILFYFSFLSYYRGENVEEKIREMRKDNAGCDWADLCIGNDIYEYQVASVIRMDEKQFFKQIFEFFGESFRRFNHRNETYINDEYAKATAPQYAELKKYLHDLKGLKGEKNIVRINELDDDETIYYFVENNDKMYVIQIDDIL